MQHYGLHTRLLDWTMGALLGLYFAVCHNSGENDAAVWILDPCQLNRETLGKGELLFSADEDAKPYLSEIYPVQSKLPKKPVAIVPPYNSDRITVQRGTFTIHGSQKDGVEKIVQAKLRKVRISKSSVVAIRRELRRCGIGEFTVFPDLDGLCREIKAVEVEGC